MKAEECGNALSCPFCDQLFCDWQCQGAILCQAPEEWFDHYPWDSKALKDVQVVPPVGNDPTSPD